MIVKPKKYSTFAAKFRITKKSHDQKTVSKIEGGL